MAPTIYSDVKKRQVPIGCVKDARRYLRYPHLQSQPHPQSQSLQHPYPHHNQHYNPAMAIINYAVSNGGAQLAASHFRVQHDSSSDDTGSDQTAAEAHRARLPSNSSVSPDSARSMILPHWRRANSSSDEAVFSSTTTTSMSSHREEEESAASPRLLNAPPELYGRFVASPGGNANQCYPHTALDGGGEASSDAGEHSTASSGQSATAIGDWRSEDSNESGICVRRFAFAARSPPATQSTTVFSAPALRDKPVTRYAATIRNTTASPIHYSYATTSSCSIIDSKNNNNNSNNTSSNNNNNYNYNSMDSQCDLKNTDGLVEIALKTIMLVRRNKLLQQRLARLQVETKQFVQSVLANPENRQLRESLKQNSDASASSP